MDSETPGPPNESPADPAPWPVVSFSILRVVIIVIELFCFAVEWNYKWCRIGGLVSGSIYNMITLKRLVLLTRTRSALFPFFPPFQRCSDVIVYKRQMILIICMLLEETMRALVTSPQSRPATRCFDLGRLQLLSAGPRKHTRAPEVWSLQDRKMLFDVAHRM